MENQDLESKQRLEDMAVEPLRQFLLCFLQTMSGYDPVTDQVIGAMSQVAQGLDTNHIISMFAESRDKAQK